MNLHLIWQIFAFAYYVIHVVTLVTICRIYRYHEIMSRAVEFKADDDSDTFPLTVLLMLGFTPSVSVYTWREAPGFNYSSAECCKQKKNAPSNWTLSIGILVSLVTTPIQTKNSIILFTFSTKKNLQWTLCDLTPRFMRIFNLLKILEIRVMDWKTFSKEKHVSMDFHIFRLFS